MADSVLFENKPWPSTPNDSQTLYVIYDHPKDFPDFYVLRRWHLYGGELLAEMLPRLGHTLEDIREHLPPGKVLADRRLFNTDPAILEIWR